MLKKLFSNVNLRYLIIGAISFLILLVPVQNLETKPENYNFQIDASRFEFNPSILKVNPGDTVTIELNSMDVTHGIFLEGYDLNMSASPGEVSKLTFEADQRGSFRFRCSVTCGDLHPFMLGKLQVGENYLAWKGVGLVFIMVVASIWMSKS